MAKQPYLVLASALLMAAMWIWVQAIAIPHQQAESAERGTPRGNLSDLYPRWLGARELLLRGRDPYGADITREIQMGYYGRELDPSRPNDPKDQQAFAYPVYVVLLLAPTVRLPFALVHRMAFWLLAFMTAASVPLWMRAINWRGSSAAKWAWVLLTLGCFPAIQGLKLQQLSVFVAALIAVSACAVARRRFVWAGVLLALATIKPQLVFLLILWLGIWVTGDWRSRQRLFWSFAGAMVILVGVGELLLPGWIHEFRDAMAGYYRYTGGGKSILDVMFTPMWGRLTSAILASFLLIFAYRYRHAAEGTREFHWSLALALATTVVVIPMFAPYNQLLLLPGLMLAACELRSLWEKSRWSRFLVVLTAVSVFWPFLAGAGLVITLLFLPGPTVQKAWGWPSYSTFAIPIMIYALLLAGQRTLIPGERVSS